MLIEVLIFFPELHFENQGYIWNAAHTPSFKMQTQSTKFWNSFGAPLIKEGMKGGGSRGL